MWQAVRELRRARYDAAIDLQGLLKSALLSRASGAGRVVGFAPSYLRERLARVFYTEVYDPGCDGLYDPRETRHVVEINLGLLAPFGITPAAPNFRLSRSIRSSRATCFSKTGGRYALLNPGAAWPNKRWPPARLGAIAAGLRDRHGLRSVVYGGRARNRWREEVVATAAGSAVLSPRTSIADVIALVRGAAVMLSGDTGPTHIAAAVGTPLVGFYGPTRAQRNGPWAPADITISRDAICQCHHLRRCRLETMCLLDIQVDEVASALDRRLAAQATNAAR